MVFSSHLDLVNYPSNVKDLQHQQNEQQASYLNAIKTSSTKTVIKQSKNCLSTYACWVPSA